MFDSEDLEERKKEFKERLVNELFVERYASFKESIELINETLENFNINHRYNYDEFCTDYTDACMEYMDKHRHIDMMDPKQLYLYTLPILINIIEKVKNKHGFKEIENENI
jgi:hypothetical protein